MDVLEELATVVIVVTLVHHDLVDLDVLFVLDDALEFAPKEPENLIYVLLLYDGSSRFVSQLIHIYYYTFE